MSKTFFSDIVPINGQLTIADIGAALLGDSPPPYQNLLDSGNARLVCFEPDANALQKLKEKYPPPNVCLPHFVGNGEAATFYETSWGPTGSLFEPNTALLEKFNNLNELTLLVAKHPVTTVRLDDVAEIDDIDFLKIDVQGAEQMIFQNAPRLMSNVMLIHTEVCYVELYKGMPLSGDLDCQLRSMGFQYHTNTGFGQRAFLPFLNPNSSQKAFRQQLWSDFIYVRDWMNFDKVDPHKLIKLALVLHEMYGSYDLANVALAAADKQLGTKWSEAYTKWVTED